MKNKVKAVMTALTISAIACTSPKTPETTDVDTTTVATPGDTTHTGVEQNDSTSVSK